MATHSNRPGGIISRTEKPGGLQAIGSQGVRHDWVSMHTKQTVMKFHFSSPVSLLTRSVSVEERQCNIKETFFKREITEKPYYSRPEVEIPLWTNEIFK